MQTRADEETNFNTDLQFCQEKNIWIIWKFIEYYKIIPNAILF